MSRIQNSEVGFLSFLFCRIFCPKALGMDLLCMPWLVAQLGNEVGGGRPMKEFLVQWFLKTKSSHSSSHGTVLMNWIINIEYYCYHTIRPHAISLFHGIIYDNLVSPKGKEIEWGWVRFQPCNSSMDQHLFIPIATVLLHKNEEP